MVGSGLSAARSMVNFMSLAKQNRNVINGENRRLVSVASGSRQKSGADQILPRRIRVFVPHTGDQLRAARPFSCTADEPCSRLRDARR